jgi:hypothetical protein
MLPFAMKLSRKYNQAISGSFRKTMKMKVERSNTSLWIIVINFAVVNVYKLIIDLSYSFVANPETCNFDGTSDQINSLVKVFSRSLTYVYWLVAVIYVFWP